MITSKSNNKIKLVRKLLESAKERDRQGLFVVEGERIVSEVPRALLQELFVAESKFEYFKQLESLKPVMHAFLSEEGRFETVSDEVFHSLSDTVHPQGILAVVKQPEYTLAEMLDVGYNPMQSKTTGFLSDVPDDRTEEASPVSTHTESDSVASCCRKIVILDDIRDPGNMGTILRTSEAAGVAGVVLSKGCVDLFNPKVVRSTMGSIFRMPFVVCDLTDAIGELKKNGYAVYGTSLTASKAYKTVKFGGKCAIITGNEANGISPEVLALTTENIHIPMQGKVESLNAAVSLAVVLFHIDT